MIERVQTSIISQIESLETEKFTDDPWSHSSNSYGRTRVITDGALIEKGAVSVSVIPLSNLSNSRASTISERGVEVLPGTEYAAAALSLVLHTRSPIIPTFRSDVRIFSLITDGVVTRSWLGGGCDLTPYYIFDEDVEEFHGMLKGLCDRNGRDYEEYKKGCDDYFYLPARKEHRGVGGIFFDDLEFNSSTFNFVEELAEMWMPSWLDTIVERRKGQEWTEEQRDWQLIRRGRYLEFNLLYDRGVKFGLATENPRVEGILVSAPPLVKWAYNHKVAAGSEEERLQKILETPRAWA